MTFIPDAVPRFSRRHTFVAIVLAFVAVGVYANSIPNGFALDDEPIILQDTAIHGIAQVPHALLSGYWPFGPRNTSLYRPLTQASYAIGWSLWHGSPHGFHAVNALLHALVTIFVFLLLLRLGAPLIASAAGALVFAVHPVHTEAVAGIVGRAEVLAALFFVGALLEYLDVRLPRWRRALVVGVAFVFAMASKENAVTLPAVLVLLELARRDRQGMAWRERVRWEWPVVVSGAVGLVAYVVLRHHVLGAFLGNDTAPYLAVLPGWQRVLTGMQLFPQYVRLAVFPRDLIAEYGPAVILPARGLNGMVVLGMVLAVIAGVVVVTAWKRQRLFAVGVLWFALTMVPVSNLFVAVGVMMAERTLYLPSVGWSIVVAGLVVELARRARPVEKRALVAVGLLVVLLGAWRTWERNPAWRSTDTLLTRLAEHHPESFRAQWYVASRFEKLGNVDRSIYYFRRAVAWVGPHYPLLYAYASALVRFHRYQDAIPVLQGIVKRVPEYRDCQVMLGASFAMLGRWKKSHDAVQAAIRANPHDATLYSLLAIADAQLGNWRDALKARLTSFQYAGNEATWDEWMQLALIRARLGETAKAREALAHARQLAPDSARVLSLDSLLALPHGLGVHAIVIR